MNEYQKNRFTQRIISCMSNSLNGKKIAVLGFAFKKNTNDTRESPAIRLVSNLVAEGAQITIYDPKVREEQVWGDLVNDGGNLANLKRQVEVYHSAYTACLAADAVVVVTEWDEFSNKTHHRMPVVEDVSNALVSTRCGQLFQPDSRMLSTNNAGTKKDYSGAINSSLAGITGPRNVVDEECIPRLDWARIAEGMRRPMFVFDGRNILDAPKLETLGFRVEAVGKPSRANPVAENHK
ncbi:MAG: hypothetical protein Q9187_001375 [Circinaria calcarea]